MNIPILTKHGVRALGGAVAPDDTGSLPAQRRPHPRPSRTVPRTPAMNRTTWKPCRKRLRGMAYIVPVVLCVAFGVTVESATAQSAIDLPGIILVDVVPTAPLRPPRPAWVDGDVPDTVWMLVENAIASADEDTMKRMLIEAEGLARDATVGQEDNIGRRFALAAVLGMRADREGGRTKVGAASAMYDELVVVLELDPGHARARFMMGRLHAGVRRMNRVTRWLATNLLGGGTLKQATWERAEENLAFAEAQAPEVPDHHLQLGRLYRDTDRPELAMAEIEHVLALPAASPMEAAAREEALRLRAEWLDG